MPPSAVGTLARTPLAHALIYLRNKRLTGRFELVAPDARAAKLAFYRGRILAALTSPPVAYFGSVAYELGLVTSDILDRSLIELATSEPKKLHGEVLVAMGAIDEAGRDRILYEQVCRKVHHLFTFPEETRYAFYDARPSTVEPPMLVDPIAPAWRGLRDFRPTRSIAEVLRRVGTSPLEMINEDAVDRAHLAAEEAALARALAERPMTVAELRRATRLSKADVDLLVYLLVVAKCVEPASGARAAPSIGAMPAVSSHAVIRAPVAESGALPAVRSASSTLPPPVAAAARPPAPLPPSPSALGAEAIVSRALRVGSEDCFTILGVAPDASTEAVRAAYMRLSRAWHPDRLPAELAGVYAEVATIFAHMTRAKETLCARGGSGEHALGGALDRLSGKKGS